VVGLSKTKKITDKITGDSREVNANKTNIEKKYRENIKKKNRISRKNLIAELHSARNRFLSMNIAVFLET